MQGEDRCALTEDCPSSPDQVVVTTNGWVVDCCQPCARAACDHIFASMQSDDDLARFMVEQSASSEEYRTALALEYARV